MKRFLITISIIAALSLNVNAQGTDGFFTTNYTEYRDGEPDWGDLPALPGQHGLDYTVAAPLGSGLLLLAGMGVLYGIRRKKD
ncbi:MAG: hypothetical protein E7066_02235 [Lentimicrobiaceae bacterium]|nr:hypothetical protein [Lentimicrobiaceae bacterium]